MKLKTLLLSTVLAATPWLASAQSANKADLQDVTKNLDMDGQFFMANNIEGDLGKLAALGNDFLKTATKNGSTRVPKGLNLNAVLKDLGLADLLAYGRSAKHEKDHWVNRMYVQNGGSKKGIFSMMGKNSTDYEVINFAPSGTDLVMEMTIDTSQLISSMKNLPKCERSQKFLDRKMPAGGTAKDMLNQFKTKLSLAVKLDDKERVKCPVYPEYTFPKMHSCFRMEGINLLWKHVGNMAGFAFKMEKQADGTMIMTPKRQRKGKEVFLLLDSENDLLWAASSSEFLAECRGGGAKLAADANYKAISGGTVKGNAVAYISRQACLEIRKVKEAKLKKKDKKMLSDGMIKKIMNHLTESKNGYYAEIRKSGNGIHYVLKAPCPIKEIMCGKGGCKRGKGCSKGCSSCKKGCDKGCDKDGKKGCDKGCKGCDKCKKGCDKGCKGCEKGCDSCKKGKSACPLSKGSKSPKGKAQGKEGCACEKGKCKCAKGDKDKAGCKCEKGKCKCGKDKAKAKAQPTPTPAPKVAPKEDKKSEAKKNKKKKNNKRVVPKPEAKKEAAPKKEEPTNDFSKGDQGDM